MNMFVKNYFEVVTALLIGVAGIIMNLYENRKRNKIDLFKLRLDCYLKILDIYNTFKDSISCLDKIMNKDEPMMDGKYYF